MVRALGSAQRSWQRAADPGASVGQGRGMLSAAMSAAQRRIWHTYRAANIVLSVVNGIYGAYAFIYLKHRLQAGGASEGVLDNLLVVIVGSMFFEFFAEPITGDWADTFGRKRMVVGTYWGACL